MKIKKSLSLIALVVSTVVLFSVCANAAETETAAPRNFDSGISHGQITYGAPEKSNVGFAKTSVMLSLKKGQKVLLKEDDNMFDIKFYVESAKSNPGAITVHIDMFEKIPDVPVDNMDSLSIAPGLSWTSPKIASTYSKYRAYVTADTDGTYVVTYDDI